MQENCSQLIILILTMHDESCQIAFFRIMQLFSKNYRLPPTQKKYHFFLRIKAAITIRTKYGLIFLIKLKLSFFSDTKFKTL